jgi:hypothetical protein
MSLGDDFKFYYDILGAEIGTWALADAIIDDADSFERRTAESNCRGDVEIKTAVGKPKFEESGTLLFKKSDTGYEALRDAAQANTNLGIALYDGLIATSGNEGWFRDMRFSSWAETRPDGDTVKVAFTLVTNADSTYVSNFNTTA